MKPSQIQTFNWLIVGSQRTGKTVTALYLAAMMQKVAFEHGKTRRVIIFNPQNYNPMFEKRATIQTSINLIAQGWRMPGVFRKISYQKIAETAALKSNLFDWTIVTDGELTDFTNMVQHLRDYIIIFDDLNNIVKGNLASKSYKSLFSILAGNRIKSNEVMFTYHTFHQVPPSLWTYFQRSIVKETDDKENGIGFKKIEKAQEALTKAQMQVRAENKIKEYPERLRLSERIVWLNEAYIFEQVNGELLTKIGNVYYKAVMDDVQLFKPT